MRRIGEIAGPLGEAIAKGRTPPTSSTEGRNGEGPGRPGARAPGGGGDGAGGGDEDAPREDQAGDGRPDCPRCHGAGWFGRELPLGHPDFGKAFPCDCIADELAARRLQAVRRASNVEALAAMSFETFDLSAPGNTAEGLASLRTACDAALHFAERPEGWLVLHGGFGCGKTHLAAAIVQRRIAAGTPAVFIAVPDLLDHLRAAYGRDAEEGFDARFEAIRDAPLLVLDDLGTEAPTPWAAEKLFQLFNHRYNARLPTVITTNHDLDTLDERLRSRLGHFGFVRPFEIRALDYRGGLLQADGTELSSLHHYAQMSFRSWDLRAGAIEPAMSENLGRALQLARGFAERPEGWLVLLGAHFCGKTHLAAAIANHRAAMAEPVVFVVVPDLLDHLRATFDPASRVRYDRRFDDIRAARLLVLDDLGTESATPWAQEKLYQLLNHRYTAALPTVITTALPIEKIDARLRSRMLDRRICTIFEIRAPAYHWPSPATSATASAPRRGTRGRRP